MDENTAWERFAQTGCVGDYLQYLQCRGELPPAFPQALEDIYAAGDGRTCDRGAEHRRERSPGDGAHA